MFYIGIDLGTSSLKLILMNKNGKVEKTVSKAYPIYFPRSGIGSKIRTKISELQKTISCIKAFV